MAKEPVKYAIFDYFESETVEVGLVSNIQWESEPCDLNELKMQDGVVRVRWSAKGVKKSGRSKAGVYSAKILNFHGNYINILSQLIVFSQLPFSLNYLRFMMMLHVQLLGDIDRNNN